MMAALLELFHLLEYFPHAKLNIHSSRNLKVRAMFDHEWIIILFSLLNGLLVGTSEISRM